MVCTSGCECENGAELSGDDCAMDIYIGIDNDDNMPGTSPKSSIHDHIRIFKILVLILVQVLEKTFPAIFFLKIYWLPGEISILFREKHQIKLIILYKKLFFCTKFLIRLSPIRYF
mgnify:CR=1 FL=1